MSDQGVVRLTRQTFDQTIESAAVPVLVEFGADWCAPCRRLEPLLAELAGDVGAQAVIASVDTDAEPELRERFSVSAIPTVLVIQGGEVVKKMIGVTSRAELDGALRQAVDA